MNQPAVFRFRLYIAGEGPNSVHAVANLQAICRECLSDRHEIEIVDILKDQDRALADGVMMTPLLVKLSPAPVRKIVGSLSVRDSVLQALGLNTA
jgi:circadian clock protein KaiB